MTPFIWAQIFGALAFVVMALYSYLNIKRMWILLLNVVSSSLFIVQYIILGAYTASYCGFVAAIMSLVYVFKDKNKFLSSFFMPIFFSILYIIIGIFTYDGIVSVIPIICNVVSTFMFFMKKEYILKAINIPVCALWIIYNVVYLSYSGVVGQTLVLLADIVFLVKFYIDYKNKKEQENTSL